VSTAVHASAGIRCNERAAPSPRHFPRKTQERDDTFRARRESGTRKTGTRFFAPIPLEPHEIDDVHELGSIRSKRIVIEVYASKSTNLLAMSGERFRRQRGIGRMRGLVFVAAATT
jgi:hypothetical protein